MLAQETHTEPAVFASIAYPLLCQFEHDTYGLTAIL